MMANVYSQNGEDGYILSSLYSIPESLRSGWCVELGAWDGEYLSNCANLIHNFNYRAVMIEANKSKFKKLKRAYPDSKVIKVHRFVDVEGENCLDSVLSQTSIPHAFDFL